MTRTFKGLPVVFLSPGEFHLSERPEVVCTVLGSCLSVTMFSARHKIGAMCHSLLPACNNQTELNSISDAFKYVDSSLAVMTEIFEKYKIKKSEIQIKVFGGSEMLGKEGLNDLAVGRQNINMAMDFLYKRNFQILSSDVGGSQGRKIYFDTSSGEVYLKRLRKNM